MTKPTRRAGSAAWVGLLLVIVGVVGYFVAVFRLPWLPSIRNDAIPNWIVIAAGLIAGATAVARLRRRWTPRILLGVDVVLTSLFALMLYVAPVMPAAQGPAIGAAAPDFALADQTGRIVRLAELRGSPVLLVFYRGHW